MTKQPEAIAESPYIVTAIIWLIVTATTMITFENDQLPLGVTLLLTGTAILFWCLRLYPRPRNTALVIFGTLAVTAETLLVSGHRYLTEVSLAWLWSGGLLFLLLTSWLSGRLRTTFLLVLLVTSQVLLAVPGIWSFIQYGQRATGWLHNANGLGGALLWGVCGSLVLVILGWRRRWSVPLLIITAAALLLTLSLTALAALVVPLILAMWWYRRRIRWWYVIGLTVAGVGIFLAVWFIWKPPSLIRLMTSQHVAFSWQQRLEFDRAALRMWRVKPLTGWGLGAYRTTLPRFTNRIDEQPLFAHNLYLQMLAETGAIGGGIWLVVVAGLGVIGWRVVRATSDIQEQALLQGLYLGWLAFTIHAALDFSWYFPAGQIWWLVASAVFVVRESPVAQADQKNTLVRIGALTLGLACLTAAGLNLLAIQATNRAGRAVAQGDENLAIDQFTVASRLTKSPSAVISLVNVYVTGQKNNDLVTGEKLLRDSLRHNSQEYFLHNSLGLNLVAQKRNPEAVAEFAMAYSLDHIYHPEFAYHYIVALKNTGHTEQAKRILQQTLDRYGHGQTPNPIILRQLPLLWQVQAELLPGGS